MVSINIYGAQSYVSNCEDSLNLDTTLVLLFRSISLNVIGVPKSKCFVANRICLTFH